MVTTGVEVTGSGCTASSETVGRRVQETKRFPAQVPTDRILDLLVSSRSPGVRSPSHNVPNVEVQDSESRTDLYLWRQGGPGGRGPGRLRRSTGTGNPGGGFREREDVASSTDDGAL